MGKEAKALYLNWGPKILRDWGARIADAIYANRPVNGNGTTVDDGPDGRPINVVPGGGGGSATGGGGGTIINNPPYNDTALKADIKALQDRCKALEDWKNALVYVTGISFDGTNIVAAKNKGAADTIGTEECP